MPPAERAAASARAVARIVPLLRDGETVSLFWPMRDEIDPRGLMEAICDRNGRIAMPVIADRRMHFRLFEAEDDLEDGVFGTRHPHAGMAAVSPDLIVAPLAAFDRAGNRLGYGAGYYDQAIADLEAERHPHRLLGIAFACQEVAAVPAEPHDRPLAAIATEEALIQAGPAA